jgi:hypothetical protein
VLNDTHSSRTVNEMSNDVIHEVSDRQRSEVRHESKSSESELMLMRHCNYDDKHQMPNDRWKDDVWWLDEVEPRFLAMTA